MSKKVLLTATVQSHICQFHKPLMKLLKENGYEVHVAARDNLAEKNGLAMEYADKVFDIPFDRSPLAQKILRLIKNFQRYWLKTSMKLFTLILLWAVWLLAWLLISIARKTEQRCFIQHTVFISTRGA